MKKHNNFKIIGTTQDDAIGECFDKVAKILGLPYPGGPAISKAAKDGDPNKYHFPHPKTENPLNFSFSGLKTAVLRTIQKELDLPISHPSYDLKNHLNEQQVADFAASFENTVIDILLEKLSLALKDYPDVKTIAFAGGVSANQLLRKKAKILFGNLFSSQHGEPSKKASDFTDFHNTSCVVKMTTAEICPRCEKTNYKKYLLLFPDTTFSGDNAAMVAAAAFFEIQDDVKPIDPYHLNIYPRIAISAQK